MAGLIETGMTPEQAVRARLNVEQVKVDLLGRILASLVRLETSFLKMEREQEKLTAERQDHMHRVLAMMEELVNRRGIEIEDISAIGNVLGLRVGRD